MTHILPISRATALGNMLQVFVNYKKGFDKYSQTSSRTKSQKLNVSRLVLQFTLPNALRSCVK